MATEQPSFHSFPLLPCLLPTGKRCRLPRTDPHSPAWSAASPSVRERKSGACRSPGVVGDPWQAPWMTGLWSGPSNGSSEAWVRNTGRSLPPTLLFTSSPSRQNKGGGWHTDRNGGCVRVLTDMCMCVSMWCAGPSMCKPINHNHVLLSIYGVRSSPRRNVMEFAFFSPVAWQWRETGYFYWEPLA